MASVRHLLVLSLIFTSLQAAPASAGVLVLRDDGTTAERRDPGVADRGERVPPVERRARRGRGPRATAAASRRRRAPERSVGSELKRMRDAGAIDVHEYHARLDAFREARDFARRLPPGRRRIEMQAAVDLLRGAAREGWLIVSRLEPLWQTLARNREWWSEGPLLPAGRRVGFEGSHLVWQYVPGQGLQIHPLANFGKLNAFWRSKQRLNRLGALLDELLALPAVRAGGLAWEYYFDFGGGRAPWVSGLAQGTGLQSLARAATKLGRQAEVFPIAQKGLNIFEAPPPTGVRVSTPRGAHYLIYSFSPGLRVINGFVQAVVGLYDFAHLAADPRAERLFALGEAQARREVPEYDTGAWSMYSQARESDLAYHELLTGFLTSLCDRTLEPVFCRTRDNFERYLGEPPRLDLLTERVRARTRALIRFRLSKISTVTLRVLRRGRLVHSVALRVGRGERAFAWDVPRRAGTYEVRLSAVDLAGNPAAVEGDVRVLPARRKRRG